jgi:DNA-binding NtrC family response regulator
MPKRKKEVDEELFEANESNMESALIERDYSDRNVLVLDTDTNTAQKTYEILCDMLTGAHVDLASSLQEGEDLLEENLDTDVPYDTCVLDLRVPGVSDSQFTKEVNNRAIVMVALAFEQLVPLEDERSRAKMEPLRKLFDVDVRQNKSQD